MSYWSTGERNSLMATFLADFNGLCVIKVYNGTPPVNADTVLSGNTLLAVVSQAGGTTYPADCLDFGSVVGGAVSKDASVWKCLGANVVSGTPTFARLVVQGTDDGTNSTTQKRIQFTCGAGDGELNTGTGVTVNGTDYPISIAAFTMAYST